MAGYQDALRTPGIIPFSESSRKQIRQTPKRRRYARDRPQRWQRLCWRTPNFGFRLLFSIMALRAICHASEWGKASCRVPLLRLAFLKWHSQPLQEREREIVALGCRDEGDVHAVDLLDLVVVDLGEDHLFLHAE